MSNEKKEGVWSTFTSTITEGLNAIRWTARAISVSTETVHDLACVARMEVENLQKESALENMRLDAEAAKLLRELDQRGQTDGGQDGDKKSL